LQVSVAVPLLFSIYRNNTVLKDPVMNSAGLSLVLDWSANPDIKQEFGRISVQDVSSSGPNES